MNSLRAVHDPAPFAAIIGGKGKMLIDIHIHSSEYSHCSNLKLEDAILRAKCLGLDGICVTDHDSNGIVEKAHALSKKYDFLIIVGIEYYTYS